MSRRRVAINLGANVTAQAVSKLFPVVAYAFAQRKMGTVAFGHALFAVSLVDWPGQVIDMGCTPFGQLAVGQGRDDPERMRELTGSILTLRAINTLFVAVAMFFIVRFYYQDYQSTVLALSFMLLSSAADLSYIQTGTRAVWQVGALSVISKILAFILLLALVHGSNDATTFAVLVAGANSAVSFATFVLGARRWRPRLPTWAQTARLYQALLPFAALTLCSYLLDRFDYFLVEAHLGREAVGLYGGVSRVYASILSLIPAVTVAFGAEMLSARTAKELAPHVAASLEVILGVTLPIGVGAWFVSPFLLQFLFDAQYTAVAPTFALLCLALIPFSVFMVVGMQALVVRGRTWYVSRALAASAIVGIGVEEALVGPCGTLGAGIAVLVSKIVVAGLVIYGGRDMLPSCRRFGQLVAPYLLAATLMGLTLWWLKPASLVTGLASGALVYGISVLALCWKRLGRLLKIRRLP